MADGDDPGGRADAGSGSASPTWGRTTSSTRHRHPPRPARLARALHRHHHRALRRGFPLLARSCAGASDPGRRGPPRGGARLRGGLDAEGFRVDVDERDETLGKRIRDAELEKIPFTIVYGDRESDESLAVRERRRRAVDRSMTLEELLQRFRAGDCYDPGLKVGADHAPHLPEPECWLREGSTEPVGRGKVAAACSGFSSSMRRIPRAW